MDRGDFLLDVAKYAAMCAVIPNDWRVVLRPRWAGDDPFGLGVASGDPTSSAVMIWTRLAPRPLEPDGGMSRRGDSDADELEIGTRTGWCGERMTVISGQ